MKPLPPHRSLVARTEPIASRPTSLPPHPATIIQAKSARPGLAPLPPHPATVVPAKATFGAIQPKLGEWDDGDDDESPGTLVAQPRRRRPQRRRRQDVAADDEEQVVFERHLAIARNNDADPSDPFRQLSAMSGDGATLRRLLFARPDKIHADRLLRILTGINDVVGGRNRGRHQFDCAEPHVVANHAMLGVALEHIEIISITMNGQRRPPCQNCQQWLVGGRGRYVIRQACLDRSWRDRYRIGLGRMSGTQLRAQLGL